MFADRRRRSKDTAGPSSGGYARGSARRSGFDGPMSPGGMGNHRQARGSHNGYNDRASREAFQPRMVQPGLSHDIVPRREHRDAVSVAVRFRPLSKKERLRGDSSVWDVDDSNTVGLITRGVFKAKFKYDHVFRGDTSNQEVYQTVAGDVVRTAMNGINGTVFAYGVTSSGKTHTMMGNPSEPGIVPQSVHQLFELIENMPSKEFLLRLSMMEIYNEVLNDLLDPTRTNLKIRVNSAKGIHVEGLKEEVVLSAEHALSLIAAGEANRKVGSTAFNEDSSRSHIVCRFSIEISDRVEHEEDGGEDCEEKIDSEGDVQMRGGDNGKADHPRTLSYLNLIDLAGSESAKATDRIEDRSNGFSFRKMLQKAKSAKARGKRMEGSYINKSLLTLGTVIHKLSEGRAAHVPFRDSKLTRLLQPSLSGSGAKVAIICTVTPASAQAEETNNTLKFAQRAKRIEIKAERNEIMDSRSLIKRYQVEIADLKRQLELLAMEREAPQIDPQATGINKDIEEQLYTLRERVEEELRARLKSDEDKLALEARVSRLTRLILHSSQFHSSQSHVMKRQHLRSRSFDQAHMEACVNLSRAFSDGHGEVMQDSAPAFRNAFADPSNQGETPGGMSLLNSGEASPLNSRLCTPTSTSYGSEPRYVLMDSSVEASMRRENAQLRERLELMAEEMAARQKDLEEIKLMLRTSGRSALNTGSTNTSEGDLEMSVLHADREVLQDTLSGVRSENRRLLDEVVRLKVQLKRTKKERDFLYNEGIATPKGKADVLGKRKSANARMFGQPSREIMPASPSASSTFDATSTCSTTLGAASESSHVALTGRWSGGFETLSDNDMKSRLVALDHQVQTALAELVKKDQDMAAQREEIDRVKMLEQGVAKQLKGLLQENERVKNDHRSLELHNNRLQGYLLDGLSGDDLNNLIVGLTQAAERVKLCVQMRKLQTATSPGSGRDTNKQSSE